jgi:hypothetical protein
LGILVFQARFEIQLIQHPSKYENFTLLEPKTFYLSRALHDCGHTAIRGGRYRVRRNQSAQSKTGLIPRSASRDQ